MNVVASEFEISVGISKIAVRPVILRGIVMLWQTLAATELTSNAAIVNEGEYILRMVTTV